MTAVKVESSSLGRRRYKWPQTNEGAEEDLQRFCRLISSAPPLLKSHVDISYCAPTTLERGQSALPKPFRVQLSFRTRMEEGLILCALSPGDQEEFVALQMRNGRPYFLFDPQV
ncbi:usherin [Tachysurus ichikawai]